MLSAFFLYRLALAQKNELISGYCCCVGPPKKPVADWAKNFLAQWSPGQSTIFALKMLLTLCIVGFFGLVVLSFWRAPPKKAPILLLVIVLALMLIIILAQMLIGYDNIALVVQHIMIYKYKIMMGVILIVGFVLLERIALFQGVLFNSAQIFFILGAIAMIREDFNWFCLAFSCILGLDILRLGVNQTAALFDDLDANRRIMVVVAGLGVLWGGLKLINFNFFI
jgi:hypothetical protein